VCGSGRPHTAGNSSARAGVGRRGDSLQATAARGMASSVPSPHLPAAWALGSLRQRNKRSTTWTRTTAQ